MLSRDVVPSRSLLEPANSWHLAGHSEYVRAWVDGGGEGSELSNRSGEV